ncbi:alternative ribosome rescue aminoacyl-tRNA hydrolase ArfB [Xanthobacter tagetidis]|uniref:Aminoacyl-tRNA hydrolase n=1 Tax=Xanthobacter tagetidis TaxID=60216 RepID=A0A3L7AKJ5_9HYPH|nr:alternative ribosome rescue aminoacyl-tRNA hydrolase ArfB [Xanthobacter tagetidis]MBB6306838.1 ribosome-associated protein [Xanthobacter tagetidis]RLP80088.1 aminoacyl-tRNA hydrolase [Xanthobacter tagetidis]
MIEVSPRIRIPEEEIVLAFVRASGPGGQNVNKVSSAVQLRFDVAASPSLPEAVKARLAGLAGRRLTREGVLVIQAQRFRTQERNRDDAIERLVELVRAALKVDPPRRPTRPTLGSKTRRLESKARRGAVKSLRQDKPGQE